jgi:NitT/TauT family transport system substrate-binding protein
VRRAGIAAVLLVILMRHAAAAETAALRIVRPLDLAALPLIVMEHEHLIERTAEAMGLGAAAVTWRVPDGRGALAMLTNGRTDLAMADVVPFLVAAETAAASPTAPRALGSVVERPYVLVTRNKAIHTIRDFRTGDHIAVPAIKLSGPAVMLEMAAAQEWGGQDYARLDPLVVARPDAVAADALLSGAGGIDAHFSRSPYVDAELADPAVHRVMDSFDIAGPHSDAVLATTTSFAAANPELCKAVLSALQAADDYIGKTPGAAAEIFAGAVKDQDLSLEELSDMIGDPDLAYRAAPAGVLRIAQFMQGHGRLKHTVAHWQELFLPAARDLPGS